MLTIIRKGLIWPPLIIVRLHYILKDKDQTEPWAECLAYPQGLEAAGWRVGHGRTLSVTCDQAAL